MEDRTVRIVVIGTGFGGMTVTGLIAQKGCDVPMNEHTEITSEIHAKVIAES